jgi:hypothetical protein
MQEALGGFVFGPVDFVDLKKRLPKEAGVVHPQAIIIFTRSKYDPYNGSRPSLVQETSLTVVPTSKSTLLLSRV